MLRIKLREAMEAYRVRTGEKLTYETLAQKAGLSKATLDSLASRQNYNTRLSTIEKLCLCLGCQPGDLLELDGKAGLSKDED